MKTITEVLTNFAIATHEIKPRQDETPNYEKATTEIPPIFGLIGMAKIIKERINKMDWQKIFGDDVEVVEVDMGGTVICDICDKDWTKRNESGGFLFGSYAYCPDCAEEGLQNIKRHGETHMIKATCPVDMSFADWIRGDMLVTVLPPKKSGQHHEGGHYESLL